MAVIFAAVVVILIVARRGVVGEHARPRTIVVALAGTFIVTLLAVAPSTTHAAAVRILGNLVMSGGLAFAAASLISLGCCFGILPEARGLVTRGPYR